VPCIIFLKPKCAISFSAIENVFGQRTCPSKKRDGLSCTKTQSHFLIVFLTYSLQLKRLDMNELLKKRAEITIKLNNATQKLVDEGNGFIDKKYFVEVSKWNQELEKIQAEIEKVTEYFFFQMKRKKLPLDFT
jgi:hypothetical protein